MPFDPGAAEGVIKKHPVASALGGLGIVLIVWWAVSRGGSAPQSTAVPNDTSGTAAAAGIQNAQIAAGVANNQTAAQQTVALAQIQGATDAAVAASTAATTQAYYGAATAITSSNNGTYLGIVNANDTLAAQTNSTVASEMTTLSGVLSQLLGGSSGAPGTTTKTVQGNLQDYDVIQGLLGVLGSQSNAISVLSGAGPAPAAVNAAWNSGVGYAPGSSFTSTGGGANGAPGAGSAIAGFTNIAAGNLASLTGPEAHS